MASVSTFIDYSASYIMLKQHAELYERLYQWAAEDFVTIPDNNIRHEAINAHMLEMNTTLQIQVGLWLDTHVHTSATPGSPTSPPIVPLVVIYPIPPPLPVNTTGAQDNLTGNFLIPYEYLSYVDLRDISTNQPISTFRRALEIPINSSVITPSLTRL